ncbi:3,4-dihydroxy-2-butanone-4-phosphate synthase [Saccharopolyspora sp. K220]|uniref:3,4-dihydroxy-2-butanone-4-phosphate synthase n=1 Tax=Saccharopolyspora soli TaxID=2926618 RepID=UPI001F5AC436|nr:3,4-dihydroxy-2-butanone-4-phosphate synthase [Saccharopolyspora soli]MCI2419257.1 3,4-dihydroxy-2-butanone-4-phosphate synthase [Saccharopolyspora soli]
MAGQHAAIDHVNAIKAGKPVLIVGRDQGVVALAASRASTTWTAWVVRHSSGLLCVALDSARADELRLPPMESDGTSGKPTFAVSVDAASGATTGISASDRAHCARLLADPSTRPEDLRRPGHVLPIRVPSNPTPAEYGFAEAATDLCRRAGLPAVALLAVVVDDSGTVASPDQLRSLGAEYGVGLVDCESIAASRFVPTLRKVASIELSGRLGSLRADAYLDTSSGVQHLVIFGSSPGPVSAHLECIPGTIFGSSCCRCRADLDAAVARLHDEGGILVYLRTAQSGQHQEMTLADRAISKALLESLA